MKAVEILRGVNFEVLGTVDVRTRLKERNDEVLYGLDLLSKKVWG